MPVLRHKLLAAVLLLATVPTFTATPSAFAQTPKPSSATATPLDINTATPEQLKALPGIGNAYTKRIIDGRPYTAKNQLTTRGIIPQQTYDAIKDQIVASHPRK